jgi:hypothetical protein
MQQESTSIRRWRARAATVLAVLLLSAAVHSPALARKGTRHGAEPPLLVLLQTAQPYAGKALDRIVAAAEKRYYPARVRRVEEITVNGRRVYVLRLQKDGKIWEIKVDAETEREL